MEPVAQPVMQHVRMPAAAFVAPQGPERTLYRAYYILHLFSGQRRPGDVAGPPPDTGDCVVDPAGLVFVQDLGQLSKERPLQGVLQGMLLHYVLFQYYSIHYFLTSI